LLDSLLQEMVIEWWKRGAIPRRDEENPSNN